ncbi:MAG: hypothetical protein M9894_04000 [Planctomycetes bacterium]|nr:hypothetical protein [Planctomycetota bacterium]
MAAAAPAELDVTLPGLPDSLEAASPFDAFTRAVELAAIQNGCKAEWDDATGVLQVKRWSAAGAPRAARPAPPARVTLGDRTLEVRLQATVVVEGGLAARPEDVRALTPWAVIDGQVVEQGAPLPGADEVKVVAVADGHVVLRDRNGARASVPLVR